MQVSNRGMGNRPRTFTGESVNTKGTAGSFASTRPFSQQGSREGTERKVPDAIVTVPTSTTKALLLSIAVPRVYRVYIPPKEQPDATKDANKKRELSDDKATLDSKPVENKVDKNSNVHPLLRDTKDQVHPLKKGLSSLSASDTESSHCKQTDPTTSQMAPTQTASNKAKKMLRREPSLDPDLQKIFQEKEGEAKGALVESLGAGISAKDVSTEEKEGETKEDPGDVDEVRVVEIENERTTSESIQEHDVGYVENENPTGRNASIVEHVITKEEMEMIVKIEESDSDENSLGTVTEGVQMDMDMPSQTRPDPKNGQKQEPPHHKRVATDSSVLSVAGEAMSVAGDAIKNFFGVMNKNNVSVATSYLSRDEAVAAIKQYEPPTLASMSGLGDILDGGLDESGKEKTRKEDAPQSNALKPNTEIKLEELLRFTFRNLYNEDHFFNAPIFTGITSRLDPLSAVDEQIAEDWIELSVMVKQSSIGIILERMERIGVGSSVGTIAIFKAELLRTCTVTPSEIEDPLASQHPTNSTENKDSVNKDLEAVERLAKMDAARAEWKNAASRLRVEQVKEQIQEQAELSLDYLALLTIASILAGIGLITDNSVVIVASMLVSPIMGPVMGITFGSRVLDWNLALRSMWNEFLSLLLAVLIGAIIGVCTSFCPVADNWPTEQMSSRGDTAGLVTGIAIAIPSGMGVALSILGNNTSSLVGVAISASLLPPAVNAGICWVYAIVGRVSDVYGSQNEDFNFNLIAGISFALTMLNIVCIWASGILMFQIKEVAPTKSKSAFWSRDIKVARAIQKGSQDVNLDVIKAGLQDVIKKERKEKKVGGAPRKRRGDSNLSFNMSSNPVDETAPIVNIQEFVGVTPLADDVKYYGLEDMAHLFGFDEEDDFEEGEKKPSVGFRV